MGRTLKANNKGKRSFRLVKVNGNAPPSGVGGNLKASNPKAAASKGFTSWCRNGKKSGECTATVTVMEITRGNEKKTFTYNAVRRTITDADVNHGNNAIKYNFMNVLYSTKPQRSPTSRR